MEVTMLDGISSVTSASNSLGFSESAGQAQEQQDQFLKLLTYQLKSQNPLKPYDNQEFAAQLAQFSQLEQLSEIKDLMASQNQANVLLGQTMSNSALPGMLGKNAKAYTSHLKLGEEPAKIGLELDFQGQSGQVTILDELGRNVRTINLSQSNMRTGDNIIEWDGTDDNGDKVDEGTYTFFADVTDSDGTEYEIPTFSEGVVEAVRFKSNGTVLLLNGQEVSLGDVKSLEN